MQYFNTSLNLNPKNAQQITFFCYILTSFFFACWSFFFLWVLFSLGYRKKKCFYFPFFLILNKSSDSEEGNLPAPNFYYPLDEAWQNLH